MEVVRVEVTRSNGRKALEVEGSHWKSLEVVGSRWKLLEVVGSLEVAEAILEAEEVILEAKEGHFGSPESKRLEVEGIQTGRIVRAPGFLSGENYPACNLPRPAFNRGKPGRSNRGSSWRK